MKYYIRQIRPYYDPYKLDLYGEIVRGYNQWYPEEEEERLEKEIPVREHYILMFEERYIEVEAKKAIVVGDKEVCPNCYYSDTPLHFYCPECGQPINRSDEVDVIFGELEYQMEVITDEIIL